MASYGQHPYHAQQYQRAVAALAIAPHHVRHWLIGREVLLRHSPQKTQAIETEIAQWLGKRKKSLAYFGAANDASMITVTHSFYGYNHFVFIDSKPDLMNGFFYESQNLNMLQASFKKQLVKQQSYKLQKVILDPANSRFVMLFKHPRFGPVALEYYYDTSFEMLETPSNRRMYRPLLASKLKKVTGLTSRGAGLPRVHFRDVFPRVKQLIDADFHSLLNSPANKKKLLKGLNNVGNQNIFDHAVSNVNKRADRGQINLAGKPQSAFLERYEKQLPLFEPIFKEWYHTNAFWNKAYTLGRGLGRTKFLPTPRQPLAKRKQQPTK